MGDVPGSKRKLGDAVSGAIVVSKKARPNEQAIVAKGPPRCSGLQAPVMCLTGHGGEVFTSKFSPRGDVIASGSFDRNIYLWNTYGDCENFALLAGHAGPIVELQWTSDSEQILAASTDKTCGVWDALAGQRIRKLRHKGIVNSCAVSPYDNTVIATASDDSTVRIWDSRRRNSVHDFALKYQVTAVSFGGTEDHVVCGGLDNVLRVWDLRKNDVVYTMQGHTDTVTCLRLSPDRTTLLSNSMDNTVRTWDVQPYARGERQLKVFQGAQHNFEKNLIKCNWSSDGRRIACGSADRNVYIWDATTGSLVYCLPGHKGTVNEVDFHPKEPIVLSCGSDKRLYLGELNL